MEPLDLLWLGTGRKEGESPWEGEKANQPCKNWSRWPLATSLIGPEVAGEGLGARHTGGNCMLAGRRLGTAQPLSESRHIKTNWHRRICLSVFHSRIQVAPGQVCKCDLPGAKVMQLNSSLHLGGNAEKTVGPQRDQLTRKKEIKIVHTGTLC